MWRNQDVLQFVEWMRARNDAHAHPATKVALLRARPLQPASLDRGGDRVPRSRRPRRGAPSPRPVQLLRPRRARRSGLRLRARARARDPVRERGRRAARRAAEPGRRVPAPRRLGRRGRALLRRAERSRRARRRGVLPADVPRRGLLVEPPRSAHGRHARRARRAPRPADRPDEGRRLGAQLARRRRASHRDGRTRRAQRRPARAPALRQRLPARRLHDVRRQRHRRVRTGATTAERKRVRPALPGSHEALLHEVGAPNFWIDTAAPRSPRDACARRGSSARSA